MACQRNAQVSDPRRGKTRRGTTWRGKMSDEGTYRSGGGRGPRGATRSGRPGRTRRTRRTTRSDNGSGDGSVLDELSAKFSPSQHIRRKHTETTPDSSEPAKSLYCCMSLLAGSLAIRAGAGCHAQRTEERRPADPRNCSAQACQQGSDEDASTHSQSQRAGKGPQQKLGSERPLSAVRRAFELPRRTKLQITRGSRG